MIASLRVVKSLVFLWLLIVNVLIAQAADVIASPNVLDMGKVTAGSSKTMDVSIETPLGDGPVITAFFIKNSGGEFLASSGHSLPFNLGKSNPMTISIAFSPKDDGGKADILEVEYVYKKVQKTLTVNLKGKGGCTSALEDCEQDACAVDKNLEGWVSQKIDGLTAESTAAISVHTSQHYNAVSTYTLPGNFFWTALGLKKLFDEPKSCCVACGSSKCLPEIQLNRVTNKPTLASFTWELPAGQDFVSVPNSFGVEAKISVPKLLTGKAIIRAGSVDYFFVKSSRPALSYVLNGKAVFVGEIACFSTATDHVAVRHGAPGSAVPNLHLEFNPN